MKLNGEEVDAKASMPLVLLNPELILGEEKVDRRGRLPQFPGDHGGHRARQLA